MLFYITEDYTIDSNLSVLQEKLTREQYARKKFKKKYNFEPSKENKDIGFITKEGKRYKIDMRNSKYVADSDGNEVKRPTAADNTDKDSTIYLDKNFFKLKGSKHGERRDAILNHEIGHQNFHNFNPENKTVDKKNRTPEVFKNCKTGESLDSPYRIHLNKNERGIDKDKRKKIYDSFGIKEYIKNGASEEEKKHRDESLDYAKRYEKNEPHQHAYEIEADRYAANRTSDSAIKKAIRNAYKLDKKDRKKELIAHQNKINAERNKNKRVFFKMIKDKEEWQKNHDIDDIDSGYLNDLKNMYNKRNSTINRQINIHREEKNAPFNDYLNRTKALKDKDLQNSDVYK